MHAASSADLPSTDPRDRFVDALMRLLDTRDWHAITLQDVAEAADLTLADLRAAYPSKGAMLGAFSRRIDLIVLSQSDGEDLAEEAPRERLFDVFMRRLDALAPYRRALRRVAAATRRDPAMAAALYSVAVNSQRFMLAAAGLSTEDDLAPIKLNGAVLVFARTLEVWLEDEDSGLSRTMARLDRELDRAERAMRLAGDLHRLTAPLRAACRSLCDAGGRRRRRASDEDGACPEDDASGESMAAAI